MLVPSKQKSLFVFCAWSKIRGRLYLSVLEKIFFDAKICFSKKGFIKKKEIEAFFSSYFLLKTETITRKNICICDNELRNNKRECFCLDCCFPSLKSNGD
jgi:hypothetical protein